MNELKNYICSCGAEYFNQQEKDWIEIFNRLEITNNVYSKDKIANIKVYDRETNTYYHTLTAFLIKSGLINPCRKIIK